MQNDSVPGKFICRFFEASENKNLFSRCPFRPYLSHLHDLDTAFRDCVLAHMLGHILDYRAGQESSSDSNGRVQAISQENIHDELRFVYNDCNNSKLNDARRLNPTLKASDDPRYQGFGPEQRGCFGADARAELMAEAIRAYLQDPNYLKTVAPNVAARIRDAVNTNHDLNWIIHFN